MKRTHFVGFDLDGILEIARSIRQRIAMLVAHVLRPDDIIVTAGHVTISNSVVIEDFVEPSAVEYHLVVVILADVDQFEIGIVFVLNVTLRQALLLVILCHFENNLKQLFIPLRPANPLPMKYEHGHFVSDSFVLQ